MGSRRARRPIATSAANAAAASTAAHIGPAIVAGPQSAQCAPPIPGMSTGTPMMISKTTSVAIRAFFTTPSTVVAGRFVGPIGFARRLSRGARRRVSRCDCLSR